MSRISYLIGKRVITKTSSAIHPQSPQIILRFVANSGLPAQSEWLESAPPAEAGEGVVD
jgi:hypothetical protein